MPVHASFDYAVIRIVPRVDREEFLNAGVVLFCLERDFLSARVHFDEDRALALFPDTDVGVLKDHLAAFVRIADGGSESGPIGALSRRERFHWLVAPRSTVVQVGPVHSGVCEDPQRAIKNLLDRVVRIPGGTGHVFIR